jgi:hypothetical protein
MEGSGGARSGGERRTPPEKARGLGFKDGNRCYVTFPRAQRLTGAAAVYDGAASRAGRAVPAGRASGSDTRRARTSVAPRSAGSPREGATPREVCGRRRATTNPTGPV